MTIDELLIQLKRADSPAAQAALVAESVLSDLPLDVAVVARRCAFLPWFNNDLIRALWLDQQAPSALNQTIAMIIDLPFVEPIPWGYKYHDLTRKGLLSLHQENNSNEIIQACQAVIPLCFQNWEDESNCVIYLILPCHD